MACVSIHALRTEGDAFNPAEDAYTGPVSIHALRTEGDYSGSSTDVGAGGFQSTPSARRATESYFADPAEDEVSIHALRTEGDQ